MSTIRNFESVDAALTIVDSTDPTKKLQFNVAGVTTGNTRVLTIPDANTTISGSDTSETLSNKTLSTPTVSGDITFDEATNDLILAVADQTVSQPTVTIPDLTGTSGDMTVTNASQTLTNKTLTAPAINYIDFDVAAGPAHTEGRVFYDDGEHTLAVYNDEADVTLQLGQEDYVRVYNNSGATITNGNAVYVSGTEGTENRPAIALARSDAKSTSAVIGFATHDIENNTFGYVTAWGLINDLNTSAFTSGDAIYLDETTAGAFRSSPPPEGNFEVLLGFVVRSDAALGRVLVTIIPNLGLPSGDAREIIIDAQKGSAGTINAGEAVYISGYDTGADVTEVELADASAAATMPAIGIARDSFTQTTTGSVIVIGTLENQNTSSYSVGDSLYISETAGALTNIKPTGTALIQKVGVVGRSHASQGVIDIIGAGRTNDLPNLPSSNFWMGDGSGVPAETTIDSLTADATPDGAADYVMTWDANASAHKKVLLNNLPGGGGGDDLATVLAVGNITGGSDIVMSGAADTLNFTRTNNLILDAATIATADRTVTLPDPGGADTVAYLALAQTLTNKTLTAPILNSVPTLSLDDTDSAFDLTVQSTSTLTAGRTLTLDVNDAARTIGLGGNITTANAFTTSGNFALTLTQTAATNVTLPTTGTLATLAGTETFTNKTLTSPIINQITTDGTEEVLIFADAGTAVNEFTMTNAPTGTDPLLSATGGDTNIGIALETKGSGTVSIGSASATDSGILELFDDTGGESASLTVPTAITTSYTLTLPDGVGSNGQFLRTDGSNPATLTWASPAGGGDVTGPGSSTDNALVRWDGASGTIIQNSSAILSDTNSLTGLVNVGMSGDILDANGNELIDFVTTGSAVNQIAITNAATGTNPTISATGGDTNIGISLQSKGTGTYRLLGTATASAAVRLYEDTDNGTNFVALTAPTSITGDRTHTLPDVASDTVTLNAATQTLTNKTMSTGSTWSGNTITVARGGTGATTLTTGNFLQGNGTGAVTATKVVPTGAVVGTTDTQTLTNKTMTATSNNVTASALFSATTTVSVSAATAPTSGQVLTATGGTAATWQTPAAGAITNSSQTATADTSTTSSTYVVMNSMTVTPASGTYLVMFSSSGTVTANSATGNYAIHNNGTATTHSERDLTMGGGPTAGMDNAMHTQSVETVTGSEAIDIRFQTTSGSFTVHERSLILIKLS